jgi:hypothetical protein
VQNSEKLRKKAVLELEIRCSIRLSYGRKYFRGSNNRTVDYRG